MEDQNNGGVVDSLAHAFHDFINGDSFKQGLKDAWAKHFGGSASPSDHDKAVQQMTEQNNAAAVQRAQQSFIKPDVAADIRKKAAK